MTGQSHTEASYAKYWIAWGVLLVITLAMIFIGEPTVLIAGITLKAAIISLWFMHLWYERFDFSMCVLIGSFATGLILFLLIVPDALVM